MSAFPKREMVCDEQARTSTLQSEDADPSVVRQQKREKANHSRPSVIVYPGPYKLPKQVHDVSSLAPMPNASEAAGTSMPPRHHGEDVGPSTPYQDGAVNLNVTV